MNAGTSMRVRQGDVWLADLEPVAGHEQGGRRPAVIISNDLLHAIPSRLVVVVPVTTHDRNVRSHVPIQPPNGGLDFRSFGMTEQFRSISTQRLVRGFGKIDAETLGEIMKRVRWFLDLTGDP